VSRTCSTQTFLAIPPSLCHAIVGQLARGQAEEELFIASLLLQKSGEASKISDRQEAH